MSLALGVLASVACSDDDDDGDDDDTQSSMDGVANEDPATTSAADDGGGAAFDNVAACESFVDALQCGGIDLSDSYPCSIYADVGCNIADYFDCLRDEFSCVDGVPDLGDALSCAELATCT